MITDLRLQHFRSYGDMSVELAQGVNIIVGPNASGKTNILEAVLMIASGSSYRAHDSELIAHGATWARLDADTPTGSRVVKLQTSPEGRLSKSFEIDGQSLTRLLPARTLPFTLFEPNHLQLLHGAPEHRRNFLDDLLEQSVLGYGTFRRHYRRVLTQRNNLLKRTPADMHQQLFVWNLRLGELGGKIVRERLGLAERFEKRLSELYSALAGRKHQVNLVYQSQFAPEQYESDLLKKLEANIDRDAARGFTASGPHREDFIISIDGHPAALAASRGETRTLVLALKIMELQLLHEVRNTAPLLLLDDVFSELDGKRRQALTQFVADYQTFITTTDADVVVQHFTSSNIIPVRKS